MKNKVADFIEKCQLLSHDDLHVVALSGGADSVALMRVLLQLGYRVEAVHCNFHLRGEESDRDELFVKNLCEKQNVRLHLIHFDTRIYAEAHQVSIEMAARQLRYHYFSQLAADLGATTVCVAHHQDDAIETLLINLLRGTGIHGLTGIRPRNGIIVRPLLCVSRADILGYLASMGQDYVTDSTNLVPDVLRNKIRLQLLPLMEQLSPSARTGLLTTARNMAEAEEVYNHQMEEWLKEVKDASFQVPCSSLLEHHSTDSGAFRAFLHEWLSPMGFTPSQTSQVASALGGQAGKTFSSSTHELLIDRDSILLQPIGRTQKSLVVPEPGLYRYTENTSLRAELCTGAHIIKDSSRAGLDAAALNFPLTLRPVQAGDRFLPFGMKGSRLVSDFLTDLKLSLFDKRRQLVVTDATGLIVWVVGRRTAHHCRVTPDTRQTLVLQFVSSLTTEQ